MARRALPLVRAARALAVALAVGAAGCASWAPDPPAPPVPEPERALEIVPHTIGAFGADAARLPVEVRMASAADLAALEPPEGELREVLLEVSGKNLLASGAGFVLAAQGCIPCLSAAVLGAGLAVAFAPAALAIDAVLHEQARRIDAAVVKADLPAQVRAALARLRPATDPGAEGAELIVVGYGFAEAVPHGACFFLDARLRARGREDGILLGPLRRSDDAPAPHCAWRGELAADEGALSARFLAESAEILAATALARLEEQP